MGLGRVWGEMAQVQVEVSGQEGRGQALEVAVVVQDILAQLVNQVRQQIQAQRDQLVLLV